MFIRGKYIKRTRFGLVYLLILTLLVGNLGLAPRPSTGQPALTQVQVQAQGQTNQVKPSQVIISLAPGVDGDRVAQDFGAEVVRRGTLNYVTLEFKETTDVQEVIKLLKKTPGILGAEENYRRTITNLSGSFVPSDTLFQQQWSMVKGNVQGAWDMGATGLGVTVAIIDTGVELNHPDLRNNLVPGYNAITGSETPGENQDNNGHGTHVSGIAAAERNNVGIVGVAYQAKIMPIKAMDSLGEGYDDVIAAGIVWAADHGAKIINLSLGSEKGEYSDIMRQSIAYANNKGCLLIAAAGNYDPKTEGNPGVSYPASDPGVLAVTATDQNNNVAEYSVTGPEVVLAAPGDSIASAWWSETTGAGYAEASGTSMAAPFVAGEAALIWSQHLDWSRDQVLQILQAGVKDIGSQGRDNNYGYGLVDVRLALTLANQTLNTFTAPASVNELGGIVQAKSGSTQQTLTIPTLAFDSTVNVSLNPITPPASLPNGAVFSTPAFQVEWGSITPKVMLSLKLNDPSLKPDTGLNIYRWNGSRWIALGGEIISGEARLGLFSGGIYAVGTSQVSTEGHRFAGVTAEGTAIKISKATFTTGADTVILAQVNQFPDALAGAPLGYKLQAPILLSPSSGLTEDLRAELERLAPKTIYLLGGTSALSATIQVELQQKYEVKRLFGNTAEGTAAAIARELGTKGRAVVASVRSFQDALVISSWAARQGVPILLTQSQELSLDIQAVIKELNITESLVIGGTAVVGPKVMDHLPFPQRISGVTAYDTATAVLQAYPPSTAKLLLATGENYPDALTGAVRAAFYGSMVVLVPTHSVIPASLTTLLTSWQGREVESLGGVVAMPEKVVETVKTYVE